nr:hypothetical protein BaRGS_003172 [Batillaria attramentaria]
MSWWFSVSGQLYGVTSVTHTSLDNAKWCCANTGWHVRLAVLGSPTEVLELSNYLNRTYVGGQQWEFWVGAERQEGYWQYMYWSWIPGQFAWSDGSSVNARLWKAVPHFVVS